MKRVREYLWGLVAVTLCVAVCGCASGPRLKRSEAKRVIQSVAVRETDGTLKFTLVAAAYTQGAIYLAEHSKRKVEPSTAKPAGRGYIFELIEDGKVTDRFELWPGEIWLHGHRWAIEDKATEDRARLLWDLR
jgi:hypothetical protein